LMAEGRRIEDSIISMLKQDKKTKDMGGKLSLLNLQHLSQRECIS
jgi:hypothetical protein